MRKINKISALNNLSAIMLSAACSAVLLTGCASSNFGAIFGQYPVEYQLTSTNFVLPEANGKSLSGKVQFAMSSGGRASLISDIDDVTYNTDPTIESGYQFAMLADIGLLSRLDLIYSGGIGGRIQFLGPTRAEAKSGAWSASFSYISLAAGETVSMDDTTGSVKHAEADICSRGDKGLFMVGYRKSSSSLFYGGAFYTNAEVTNVHIYQTNNTDFTAHADVAAGKGTAYGATLGYYFEGEKRIFSMLSFNFGLEAAYSQNKWTRTAVPEISATDKDIFSGGAMVGVSW